MYLSHRDTEPLFDLTPFGRPFLLEGGIYATREARPAPDFHAHAGYQLHYMLTGNMTRELKDGARQRLHGGDISVVQPRVQHRGEHGVARPCRFISLELAPGAAKLNPLFAASEAAGILRTLKTADNCVMHARAEQAAVVQQLQGAMRGTDGKAAGMQQAGWIRMLLAQLVLCAVRAIVQPEPPPHYHVIAKACALIHKNETGDLTAGQIAAQVSLSPSRFRELFREVTGQTVAHYRLSLRCEAAARKLIQSTQPITRIAHELGFSSSQYFTRSFRRYMGLTPTAWRERSTATARPAGRQ